MIVPEITFLQFAYEFVGLCIALCAIYILWSLEE